MIKNILIKTSGDTSDSKEFQNFAIKMAENHFVVVICGAGTKINNVLTKNGFDINFDNHGRVIKSWKERKIMREVLEEEQKRLQDIFIGKGIFVVAPLLDVCSVLCPINGDNLVKAYYLGFDEIYIFTLINRVKEKEEIFKNYEKVKVIGI